MFIQNNDYNNISTEQIVFLTVIIYNHTQLGVRSNDSLVSFPVNLSMHSIACVFAEFGLSINYSKSAQSDKIADLNFLGYGLGGGLPRKEHSQCIYALLYPEHPDLSWDACASRALGLYYYVKLGVDGKVHELATSVITHKFFDLHLINDYCNNFKKSIKGIPPSSNILNYDKTNLSDDLGRSEVIAKKGMKYPERIINQF